MSAEDFGAWIRTVPDHPRPGILFRDITTLLRDAGAFRRATEALAARHRGRRVDAVAGIEARGFIVGAALAHALGAGFVPLRKAGRLPGATMAPRLRARVRRRPHRDARGRGRRRR